MVKYIVKTDCDLCWLLAHLGQVQESFVAKLAQGGSLIFDISFVGKEMGINGVTSGNTVPVTWASDARETRRHRDRGE
jgi:hypothetical protein